MSPQVTPSCSKYRNRSPGDLLFSKSSTLQSLPSTVCLAHGDWVRGYRSGDLESPLQWGPSEMVVRSSCTFLETGVSSPVDQPGPW